MLSIEGLHAAYGKVSALENVSLKVESNQIICLLGANGAGKSTTLNCVSGLVAAARGRITFEGEDIGNLRAEDIVKRGVVPESGGTWFLPRMIGWAKAAELIFTGRTLNAAQSLEIGLVNKVVPPEELVSAVAHYAQRLAVAPTTAIGLAKQLLNRSLDSDRATAFREEALAQELNMQTRDANEGVDAFKERRDPDYQGW